MKNKKAPNFTLEDKNGKKHSLSDYANSKTIIYFYPKDNTSGCTIEAIEFTQLLKEFNKERVTIIGISTDSKESHKKFIEKNKLKIILLSDPEKKVVKEYGVWKEKSMYGRKYMGIERSTFLVDEKGYIIKEWRKVKAKEHAKQVLDYVKSIKNT